MSQILEKEVSMYRQYSFSLVVRERDAVGLLIKIRGSVVNVSVYFTKSCLQLRPL